jgi:hypothetical protein
MFVFNIFSKGKRDSTLCHSCAYAHVVDGVGGNRLTSCTFGFVLRPIKFGVTDCSGYFDRSKVKPVTVIEGFVKALDNQRKAS